MVAACALCAAVHVAASPGPLPPEPDRVLAREIFKELIEINTTHEHSSTEAAQAIRRRLLAADFAEDDLTFIAPTDRPAKGNLVVRYRGKKGSARPILFLGHLDVVEAKAADWSMLNLASILVARFKWAFARSILPSCAS